jgi:hypothetical protein
MNGAIAVPGRIASSPNASTTLLIGRSHDFLF